MNENVDKITKEFEEIKRLKPQSRVEKMLWKIYEEIEEGIGTYDYNELINKPSINGIELIGDVILDIPEKYLIEASVHDRLDDRYSLDINSENFFEKFKETYSDRRYLPSITVKISGTDIENFNINICRYIYITSDTRYPDGAFILYGDHNYEEEKITGYLSVIITPTQQEGLLVLEKRTDLRLVAFEIDEDGFLVATSESDDELRRYHINEDGDLILEIQG